MLADITGFSRITEILSGHPDGAERINAALNGYLGKLVETVIDHGGDVIKFAGDALICVWDGAHKGAPWATRAAAACGLRAQRDLAGFTVGDDITLSMRVCICAGEISMLHVGGVLERWEVVPTGRAVADLKHLRALTAPGQVVVSPDAWSQLGSPFAGRAAPLLAADGKTPLTDDGASHGGLLGPTSQKPMRLSLVDNLPPAEPVRRAPMRPEAEAALRMFLPGVVLSRLDQGMSDWMSELRRVSVVFAALPDGVSATVDMQRVQAMVAVMQKAVYRYDGAINKISVDEKGAVLIAAFGLPPVSHEDNAARALQAAMAMQKALLEAGVQAGIGVATGQVFCGTVGSSARCEYTVLGHVVNLAARLMEASEGRLWCDDLTAQQAGAHLELQKLSVIEVRGRTEPVQIWAPTGNARAAVRAKAVMVGRQEEREALAECLQSVVRARQSAVAVILGEAGMGKSRLLDDFERQAAAVGVRVLKAAGDAVDRNAPYHPWRLVFSDLFAIARSDDAPVRAAKAERYLSDLPEKLRPLRPLLEVVLATDLGSDDAVRHLSGEARAQQTQKLLAAVLQRAAERENLAIVIEDAHWFDSASWALFRSLRLNVAPVMWVVASRPIDDPPEELQALLRDGETRKLRLSPLSRDDAGNLACQRIGVNSLPSAVIDLIAARAEGNALYVEELALVLRDTRSIVIDGEDARLAVPLEELSNLQLPATVEGLIVSRVDSLHLPEQLTLKIASVVGRQFPIETVQDVYPLPEHKLEVPKMIPGLIQQELVRTAEVADQYLFKHVLTKEAVYGLMLFGQRRGLHRSVAEWYERRYADDLSHYLPTLAHHWMRAEEWSKALRCLELAGEQNLDRYANREAVELITQALQLDKDHPGEPDDLRRAHWHRHLAEAWFRLGRLDLAKEHGRQALSYLQAPVPTSLLATAVGLLRQVVRRVAQRYFPQRFALTDESAMKRHIWATRVLNRLTEIHIYAEDAAGCLDSGLRELNVAEPAGNSPELGKAYAVMAVVLGSVPQLRGLANRWAARAIDVTERAVGANAALAYVLSRVAIVDLYDARWADAGAKLQRAADVARTFGDRRLREEAVGVHGITLFFAGHFREAQAKFEAMKSSAHFSNNVQIQAWATMMTAAVLTRTGTAEAASAEYAQITAWVAKNATKSEVLWANGVEALARARRGDARGALELADGLLPYIKKRPVAYWVQHALAAVAETYLYLWARATPGTREAAALQGKAAIACLAMRRFGSAFPFGRPHALVWDGVFERQRGRTAKATQLLQAAIAQCDELQMPWESALAKRELGRMLRTGDPQRNVWLDKAIGELQALGARWDLERAVDERRNA